MSDTQHSGRQVTVIGWREKIALPDLGLPLIHAKIDTGARTSALHATRIRPFERNGEQWVRFHIPHAGLTRAADCEARLVDRREIRNTSGIGQERHVISTALVIAGRRWTIEISLADRAGMALPLILGRTAIRRHKVLVDAGRSFLAGDPRAGREAGEPKKARKERKTTKPVELKREAK